MLHGSAGTASLSCCDIYGNAGGDWVGAIAEQLGINGNICLDPLFCDPTALDLTLHADSPCAAENNPECGLIGAWPEGCGLTTCETAEEALSAVNRQTFDIIIADYKLPGMSGIAFFERIRATQPGAVRILISAYLDRTVTAAATAAGVQKTIEKPFRPETIEATLADLLEKGG